MKTSDIASNSDYAEEAFTFEQIGELTGDALLEFGAPWCGQHCQAASSAIKEVVTEHSWNQGGNQGGSQLDLV